MRQGDEAGVVDGAGTGLWCSRKCKQDQRNRNMSCVTNLLKVHDGSSATMMMMTMVQWDES